jgi:hypothetical protein
MRPDNDVLNEAHYVPLWVKFSPFVAMILGFVTAYWFYILNPSIPGRLAANQRPLYNFLLNKWYFDEIYDFLFVRPRVARPVPLEGRRRAVIDGGINGLAMGIIPFFTRTLSRAQSGYIFHYAFAMVLGIVVLITWMTLSRRGLRTAHGQPSFHRHLPAAGRGAHPGVFLRGDDEAAQLNAKRLAPSRPRWHLPRVALHPGAVRPGRHRLPVRGRAEWLFGLQYKVGVDGISVLFVMLTTFLMPITIAPPAGA